MENFFPLFAYPDINTRGVGKFLNSYANPRLRLGFAWLSRILPTLLVFISSYANTENVFYCLNIILLPCCDIFYLIILIYSRDGTFSIFISFYSVMWHFLPKGWLFLCYSTHNLDLWFVGKNIGNKEEIIIFHSNTFYDCESHFKILILASRRKKNSKFYSLTMFVAWSLISISFFSSSFPRCKTRLKLSCLQYLVKNTHRQPQS